MDGLKQLALPFWQDGDSICQKQNGTWETRAIIEILGNGNFQPFTCEFEKHFVAFQWPWSMFILKQSILYYFCN